MSPVAAVIRLAIYSTHHRQQSLNRPTRPAERTDRKNTSPGLLTGSAPLSVDDTYSPLIHQLLTHRLKQTFSLPCVQLARSRQTTSGPWVHAVTHHTSLHPSSLQLTADDVQTLVVHGYNLSFSLFLSVYVSLPLSVSHFLCLHFSLISSILAKTGC